MGPWGCIDATEQAHLLCIKNTSRLTEKYVAIELEALAMSWAIKKFHHYLYGQKFTMDTDQRQLVSIFSKSPLDALPRMHWLLMKTVPYDMTVKYIPSTTKAVADYLSRVPIKTDTIQLPILQVHQIINNLRCTADQLQQLH